MWMLIAVNVTLLAALLVALWRLYELQRRFLVHRHPDGLVVGWKIDAVERRHEHTAPKRSGLEEFPEENSLEDMRRDVTAVRTLR